MGITLYDVTVPSFLQVLGSLRGVLHKGLDYAKAEGLSGDELAAARLIDDMFPLSLQVQRVADHSAGALRDVQRGAFTMPTMTSGDYASLQRVIVDAENTVKGWTRAAVAALEGREVVFDTGTRRSSFGAEAFLLSFSLPNFYFHATTAYDILRARGVPIGKRDFLGKLRLQLE